MFLRSFGLSFLIVGGALATNALLKSHFGTAFQGVQSTSASSLGCRTNGIGGINRTNPEWVHVQSDNATLMEGRVMESLVAYEEFPFNHDSHDVNWMVAPDPAYKNMLTDKAELTAGAQVMECELETKYFPIRMWPAPGDRTWTFGRFIMDCGHPDHYRTEIHPPVASVFTRLEPFILPGEPAPSYTNQTLIYLNGNGGYFTYRVGGRDYNFEVPFPPRPSPNAVPRFQILSSSAGFPTPILNIKGQASARPPTASPRIGGRAGGGVAFPPGGVATADFDRPPVLQVKLPFSSVGDPNPPLWNLYDYVKRGPQRVGGPGSSIVAWPPLDKPQKNLSYSAILAVGWKETALSKGYRRIRVTFDSLKVHHDHDPFASGEWNLYVRANGQWMKFPGTNDVDDGDTVRFGSSALFFVPEDGQVSIQAEGWEDDNDGFFRVGPPPDITDIRAKDENEELGDVDEIFRADSNFGVGPHSKKSTSGDYTLNYTIQEVSRYTAGTSNVPTQVTVSVQSVKLHDSLAKPTDPPLKVIFQLGNAGRVFPTGGTGLSRDRVVPTPGVVITSAATGDNLIKFSAMCELADAPAHNPKPGHAGEAEPIDRIIKLEKRLVPPNYGQGQHTDQAKLGLATLDVTYTISVGKSAVLPGRTGIFQPVRRPPRN